jgi:pimeloyl-ACP methyl ester carboxylesterase
MSLAPRSLSIGDVELEYVERGPANDTAPVIFVHGALGDWRTWKPHLSMLNRGRAIAYTQRHFGPKRSAKNTPQFGVATHATDLARFIEALKAGPALVVGWSYGAHAVLSVAKDRPDLMRAAFLYEPGFPTYVTDPYELETFNEDAGSIFAPLFDVHDSKEAAQLLIDATAGRPGYFTRQPEDRRTVQLENAHTMPLLLNQSPPPEISADDLAALKMPVSITFGSLTRPAFAICARAAMRALGGVHHMEIPDVGHMWPEEDPALFTKLVERWLARNGV